ncbi:MAG: transcription termination/antitermination protein NusG [Candidatus Acidiferrales bacterium]
MVPQDPMLESAAREFSSNAPLKPWFALQVRTRHEVGVASFLNGKGYEPFVPLYQSRRCWSDRIKMVEAPLFPGYLFCRFDINNRLPILTTPGVIQVVGFNRTPIPIEDTEIDAIQSLVASGFPSQPWPFLQAGDRVQIDSGPLRGLEGLLVELRGSHRLVVSVSLLQRSVAVEIDSALVKALRSSPPKQTQSKARAWQLAT